MIEGLQVVDEAPALGITFRGGTEPPRVEWDELIGKVVDSYKRIQRLGLSAMGRGIASAAYGVSRLLYHAEFVGLPPRTKLAQLESATLKLILQGAGKGRRLFRVNKALLSGSPRVGGWGALPWVQHVLARHMAWVGRLTFPAPQVRMWVSLARRLLENFEGSAVQQQALPARFGA
jgi:hypothetical protein